MARNRPDLLVYTSLLYQLSQKRDPAVLETFISRLPAYRDILAQQSATQNAPLRHLLHLLMEDKSEENWFCRIVDILDPNILLDSCDEDPDSGDHDPPLLPRMVVCCPEHWLVRVFQRFELEMVLDSIYDQVVTDIFPIAYEANRYKLIETLFCLGAEEYRSLDNPVCDGWHPLCFAARWQDPLFAQAYLDAMSDLGMLEFSGSSLCTLPSMRLRAEEEPLPENYDTTILEEIALSGCREVMMLALRYGADPNARNAYGLTLLDVATDRRMRDLLEACGGRHSTSRERLLFSACQSVRRRDGRALSYIEDVLEWDPPLFRMVCAEGHNSPRDCRHMDLLLDCARAAFAPGMDRLYPAVRGLLDDADHYMVLSCLFVSYCYGFHPNNAATPKQLLSVLRSLYQHGFHTCYRMDGRNVAQYFTYRLLSESPGQFSLSQITDICWLLSRMCDATPVHVFLECQYRAMSDHPLLTQEEATALFADKERLWG